MKLCIKYIAFIAFVFPFVIPAKSQNDTVAKRITLPNGWSLTPAGRSLTLGDLPLNLIVSPTHKWLAVSNNGQSTQTIQLIDPVSFRVVSTDTIAKSWLGLAFSQDEKYLYASGGNDNQIIIYAILQNKLVRKDSLILGPPWPFKISPAGIAVNDAAGLLYVVTKENNALYTVNLKTKKSDSLLLGAEAYTCLLSPDKKNLYISLWGGGKLLVYNTILRKITDRVPIGSNPNDLCITKNGRYLFVSNANDNSVSVIDLKAKKVIVTLDAAIYPNSPAGSTSNGVALSDDEKTLFIANADNNCLAVFDIGNPVSPKSKGFIPVGWYPTAVKVIGQNIYVTNGKGFTSLPNPEYRVLDSAATLEFEKGGAKREYIGGLFKGTLSKIENPTADQLSRYSKLVLENSPFVKDNMLKAVGEKGNPVPMQVGEKSPIKYVFYIIKENRTYDQVLGDIKEGNGDSSLCLFGEKITPNLHALTSEFVLLDNFYVDAEVSADGHNWSMGGYANDYLEKTWPTGYGNRGGSYDAEGNRAIANNKDGFIWDYCAKAGVTYRTYGEFADDYKPNLKILKNHFCPYYTSWDQTVRDTTRVGQWKREFDSMLFIHAVPQMNTLRIINDHTEGLKKGRPTPFAHCADNDLAVGMFVDHLSHSSIWNESVVFVLEDDAQDGPDHVDAHRSTAYLAGGYVKRHFVDHTLYSTTSMLHTIELILGLPPMSQYDASAASMWRCFSSEPDTATFNTKPLQTDINTRNVAENIWQRKSEGFDFSKEDLIDDRLFTEVIWKAVKGIDAVVPPPKHAAFVKSNEKADRD